MLFPFSNLISSFSKSSRRSNPSKHWVTHSPLDSKLSRKEEQDAEAERKGRKILVEVEDEETTIRTVLTTSSKFSAFNKTINIRRNIDLSFRNNALESGT